MANDPNRDVLPVKDGSTKNVLDSLNPSNISRLKRSELEDKYFRLYTDYNGLKQLTNSQEAKIKKIGAKLLRVIKEKRKYEELPLKQFDVIGSSEDLHIKIMELQHENYILKDKTTVLKQQLSSHSKQHMAAHPPSSIFRRSHPSPRLTQRQASVPNINEGSFSLSNLPNSSDLQLRDADAHIGALNEEIKRLHTKIESLQNEVEKTTMGHQKVQVEENIELIKLKRLNRQLDAQLKASEHNQKVLHKDNLRLQRENEDALQLINEKQNEMIDIQEKLGETTSIQIQFQELRESIADLTSERDLLKERCETLLKTIKEKQNECQVNNEVAEIKREAALLRQELEMMRMENLQVSYGNRSTLKIDASCQTFDTMDAEKPTVNYWKSIDSDESLNLDNGSYNILSRLKSLNLENEEKQDNVINIIPDLPVKPKSPPLNTLQTDFPVPLPGVSSISLISVLSGKSYPKELLSVAENLSLQRESEYLRDMLRTQNHRCDTLEVQIMRLTQELQLNEIRFKDVVQQRDLFFRLLDNGSRTKIVQDCEDRQSMKSEKEESDCLSGETYVKNVGTYTKTSPVDNLSKLSSPTETVMEESASLTRICSPKDSAEHLEPTSPFKSPLPVPRPRNTASKSYQIKEKVSNTNAEVKVSILWLQLDDKSKLWKDPNVKALYVDFTILSKSSEDFETPQALPKPIRTDLKSMYNFQAVFPWNEDMMIIMKQKNLEDDVVIFNVVSEPEDDNLVGELQCPVVGLATASLHQFIFGDPNEDVLLPIYEVGLEKICCGTLAVRFDVPSIVAVQFK